MDGLFVDFELFIAQPSIKITPEPYVSFSGVPPRNLPVAEPSTYVSPLFELGYRFSGGTPYLAFSYRFIGSNGQEERTNAVGIPYTLSSQYRVHQFGFDLGGGTTYPTDHALYASHWSFGWRAGVQVDNVSLDTQVTRPDYITSIDNDYWAVGPHGRLELEYRLPFAPELSLLGRLDGALLFGEGQRSSQVAYVTDGATVAGPGWSYSMTKPAPVLMLILGLAYRPEALPDLRLSVGWVYEHWWSMGLVTKDENGVAIGTQGEATSNGLFLQARYDF